MLAQEENVICGNDDSDRDVARAAVISLSHSSDEAAWDKNPILRKGPWHACVMLADKAA